LERSLGELSAELEAGKAQSIPFEHAAVRHERRRIAIAMHETVCQSLSALSLEAAVLSRKLEAQGSQETGNAKKLCEMIRKAVRELHDLAHSLQQDADHASGRLPD